MTIYTEALEKGIEISNHESDLYLPMTNQVADILNNHPKTKHTLFRSSIDGKMWYDIPFAYDPWWNAKGMF